MKKKGIIKEWGLYEWSILAFFVVIPLAGCIIEALLKEAVFGFQYLAFKWFVFSMIGLRLFFTGFKQVLQPEFTVRKIFNLDNNSAAVVVRELGFANICMGCLGISSFIFPGFRVAALIVGGLYYCMAAFLHIFRKRKSKKETFAMVSDFYAAVVLLILFFMIII